MFHDQARRDVDLVELLENAVQELPTGDYSVGLNAIVRHVKAAIRHLHRDQVDDPDTCTDAIYRMNQAYEGSLKEAYRVLAGKDPSGLSPFQIETYLETHSILRPRVLVQLGRYRQDYRNPSTHDYKLDFDEDEALLAIVSVCGFAKLLINQMKSRIASEAAQERAAPRSKKSPKTSLKALSKDIARICLDFTNESSEVQIFEYIRGLAETLQSAGFDAKLEREEDNLPPIWDVVVKKGKSQFGIDVRISRYLRSARAPIEGDHLDIFIADNNMTGALLIIRSDGRTKHKLYKRSGEGSPIFVICDSDEDQISQLTKDLGALEVVD